MATNNAINLKDSGIVSYNGAGTFSALANPLTVSNGGQGNSSLTSYAVLTGGTSSTNPVQSIASVGTSGQVLTSNGAGSLPTFQNPTYALGYALRWGVSPAAVLDATTYYIFTMGPWDFNDGVSAPDMPLANQFITKAGTLDTLIGNISVVGPASNENCTLFLRLNNSSNTNLSTTIQLTSTSVGLTFTGIGLSLSVGDYVSLGFTTPTWATDPTTVALSATAMVI